MPELSTLLAQVFTGLVLGMIYVLLAIGLSLIFGLMTVVNFAHGALFMLGAYFGVFLINYTKSFWVALIVAPLMVGAVGLLMERFLIRRLYGRSPDDPLLLTFGLSLILVEGVKGAPDFTPGDERPVVLVQAQPTARTPRCRRGSRRLARRAR